jgi:hypothetical protein
MEIFPMLRPASWSGWSVAAGRDLPGFELRLGLCDLRGLPLTVESPRFAELETEALANLRRRPAEWLVTERRGGLSALGGHPLRVEYVDEFACERLLDGTFLSRAHVLLDHAVLAVAAPVRGILMAAPAIAPPRELATFLMLARRIYNRGLAVRLSREPGGMEPLSPSVFTVQDGRLSGVLRPLRGPSREIPSAP